jgi:hypothetical protein
LLTSSLYPGLPCPFSNDIHDCGTTEPRSGGNVVSPRNGLGLTLGLIFALLLLLGRGIKRDLLFAFLYLTVREFDWKARHSSVLGVP